MNYKKEGSFFDLPIAIGILTCSGEIKQDNLNDTIFIGELSLDGKIEGVNGVLPMCIEALRFGIKKVLVPKKNIKEATCVEGLEVVGVSSLQEVIDYFNGKLDIKTEKYENYEYLKNNQKYLIDFDEVKGQVGTKRALEIAVARKS